MSNPIEEALTMLMRARDLLLSESQHVANQGDWDRAKSLMELAERTDHLQRQVAEQPIKDVPTLQNENSASDRGRVTPPKVPSTSPDYPKYLVRDGALVKQGLQRGGVDVYEHAVPHEHYEKILQCLIQMALRTKKRSFSIEEIQQHLHCPRYMTYVVVSMLVREKLLIRARKGSYVFTSPVAFADVVASIWDKLQTNPTPVNGDT